MHGEDRADARNLGRRGRGWRSLLAAAFVGALLWTSSYGSDDHFPLGPMTQFAFSVDNDGGEIHSHWLEAETADGKRLRLPMDAVGSGLKRAEVEGQMDRLVRDPSLLQGIADAQRRLHPDRPALTKIFIVKQIRTLRHGKVVSTTQADRVVWKVR